MTLQIDQKTAFGVQLAVEEVFTNLVKYNQRTIADIRLEVEQQEEEIVVRLQDFDVDDFDISAPPAVDPQAPLQARRAGGLGLFLVHRIMDRVEYHYHNRTSTIILAKRMREEIC